MTEPSNLLISVDNAAYELVLEEARLAIMVELEKIGPTQIACSAERWEHLYVMNDTTYSVGGPNREPADVMYQVLYN